MNWYVVMIEQPQTKLLPKYNKTVCIKYGVGGIDGLEQDCSNSSALATELLQFLR